MFKKSDFVRAIANSRGNKLLIARRVGCDPHTLYKYIERFPELAELIAQEKERHNETLMDIARTRLHRHLLDGKPYAVSLIINKLGRREGFIDRTELSAPDSNEAPFNLEVNIMIDDSPTKDSEE